MGIGQSNAPQWVPEELDYTINGLVGGGAGPIINASPTITGPLQAAPATVTSGDTLTLTATGVADGLAEPAAVQFYLDSVAQPLGTTVFSSGSDWSWSGLTTGFSPVAHTYLARVEGQDGEWSSPVSIGGTVSGGTQGLAVAITSPLVTNDNTPTLTVTVSDPNADCTVSSVAVALDGQSLPVVAAGGCWTAIDPNPLSDGGHNVTVIATDGGNNTGHAAAVLTVDTAPPEVTLGDQVVSALQPTLAIDATDDGSGVEGVTVQVDSLRPIVATEESDGSWSADLLGLAVGRRNGPCGHGDRDGLRRERRQRERYGDRAAVAPHGHRGRPRHEPERADAYGHGLRRQRRDRLDDRQRAGEHRESGERHDGVPGDGGPGQRRLATPLGLCPGRWDVHGHGHGDRQRGKHGGREQHADRRYGGAAGDRQLAYDDRSTDHAHRGGERSCA